MDKNVLSYSQAVDNFFKKLTIRNLSQVQNVTNNVDNSLWITQQNIRKL